MPRYEYKVVPAPLKGTKARGVKSPEARFSLSVENLLNKLGEEGWEYQRAELLPSDERSGLTGSATNWRNLLVFRRAVDTVEDFAPEEIDFPRPLSDAPAVAAPAPISEPAKEPPILAEPASREARADGPEPPTFLRQGRNAAEEETPDAVKDRDETSERG